MIKGQASFALAVAVTAVSLPVNLPAAAGRVSGGAVSLVMSAAVILSWTLVAFFCGFCLWRLVAASAVVTVMSAGTVAALAAPGLLLGTFPGLTVILAASPLWGLAAPAGGTAEACALCGAVWLLLAAVLATSRWRMRKKLSDISVFGPACRKPVSRTEYPDIRKHKFGSYRTGK